MEGRMTLCNMSIEAGARMGMVAVDDVTLDYVRGRPMAPRGADWEPLRRPGATCTATDGAAFDREVVLAAADVSAAGHLGHLTGDGRAGDRQRAGSEQIDSVRAARRRSARWTTWA
jgi:homoaconitase/3-isopropylmalate dehydratase large subunit